MRSTMAAGRRRRPVRGPLRVRSPPRQSGTPPPSQPAISVIMPVCNGGPFLSRALESLAAQTLPDWELVAADDGSTDDTAAIGHAYGVQVISTENRGFSSARNTGMQAATA